LDLTKLYSDSSPSVLGFINKLSVGSSTPPHFPAVFGTGFFVHSSGLAATNRHVIEVFSQLMPNPRTGQSSLAAVLFFADDDGSAWQMLVVDVLAWNALAEFTSSDKWYGETVPDVGFVQLAVREVPALRLAAEKFSIKVGTEIATIGYPMGDQPLTALGKLNQASPFLRHGIVSSLFPCPTALPHGFTIDIMQQGGSSGSPILRASDGVVVGMMSSGVAEVRVALLPRPASPTPSTPTLALPNRHIFFRRRSISFETPSPSTWTNCLRSRSSERNTRSPTRIRGSRGILGFRRDRQASPFYSWPLRISST